MSTANAMRRLSDGTDTPEVEYAPGEEPTVPQESLIDGRRMTCPRCEKRHDILEYIPMQIVEKFAAATNPIYKCPNCRWIFSPGVSGDLEHRVRFLEETIRNIRSMGVQVDS